MNEEQRHPSAVILIVVLKARLETGPHRLLVAPNAVAERASSLAY